MLLFRSEQFQSSFGAVPSLHNFRRIRSNFRFNFRAPSTPEEFGAISERFQCVSGSISEQIFRAELQKFGAAAAAVLFQCTFRAISEQFSVLSDDNSFSTFSTDLRHVPVSTSRPVFPCYVQQQRPIKLINIKHKNANKCR